MPQRVLVISNMYPSPSRPAYGDFVHRCVLALRGAGIEVDAVTMGYRRRLPDRLLAYLAFAWRVNERLLSRRYDCIYVHQPLHSLLAALPALWCRPSPPLALNFHGHDLLPVTLRGRLLRRLAQPYFVTADSVLVPSPRFKRLFDAEFGARRSTAAQVFASGGVSARYFDGEPPQLCRRERCALFLSRWVAGKGWRLFIEVAARLALANARAQFTLAGDGPDAPAIVAAIRRAGLDGRVRMVRSDDADGNRALFRQHRYFVFASSFDESLALVNLEAMASGCVVLSCDFAAAADYLDDGVNGYTIERPRFVDRCAARIGRLDADLPAAQRIADAAMATAARYAEPRVMAALPSLLPLRAAR